MEPKKKKNLWNVTYSSSTTTPFYFPPSCPLSHRTLSSSSLLSSYCAFRQRETGRLRWRSWGSAWGGTAFRGPSPSWSPSTWHSSTCAPWNPLQEKRDGQAHCCHAGVTFVRPVCVCGLLHSMSLIDFIQPKVFRVWFSSGERSATGYLSASCVNGQVTDVTLKIQRLRVSCAGGAFWVHACKMRLGRGVMNGTELAMFDWKWAAATYSPEFTQLLANSTSLEEYWLCLQRGGGAQERSKVEGKWGEGASLMTGSMGKGQKVLGVGIQEVSIAMSLSRTWNDTL